MGSATLKAQIAAELYKLLQSNGAKSDVLGVVGSYGDTMPDEWVLERLREINARREARSSRE